MIFWLYLYPASILGGILYSTSVAGWEAYNFFMWCAIPLHFFLDSFAPNSGFGHWGKRDTAAIVQLSAFVLGTALVWDVVGVPLMSSWLGWVVRFIVGVVVVVLGGIAFSTVMGYLMMLPCRLAPRSAFTRAVVWAFVRIGASFDVFDKADIQAEVDEFLFDATRGKAGKPSAKRLAKLQATRR